MLIYSKHKGCLTVSKANDMRAPPSTDIMTDGSQYRGSTSRSALLGLVAKDCQCNMVVPTCMSPGSGDLWQPSSVCVDGRSCCIEGPLSYRWQVAKLISSFPVILLNEIWKQYLGKNAGTIRYSKIWASCKTCSPNLASMFTLVHSKVAPNKEERAVYNLLKILHWAPGAQGNNHVGAPGSPWSAPGAPGGAEKHPEWVSWCWSHDPLVIFIQCWTFRRRQFMEMVKLDNLTDRISRR